MSALQHIKDYLAAMFAGHDIETLMTHFETAIEAKVEEALADLKQEIAELRNEVIPPVSKAWALPDAPLPASPVLETGPFSLEPGAINIVKPADETTTESEQ